MSALKWDLTEDALKRTDCPCIMCQVGHAKNNQKVDVSEYTQVLYVESKNDESLCPKCFAIKRPGHKCSPKKDLIDNLKQSMPQLLQEQFCGAIIKDKVCSSV